MTSPGDESRSGFPQTVWWLILAWVAVAILAVLWGIPHEENDLADRASQALAGTGLDVDFDGRDAAISGTADRATIEAAKETVYNLRGVRHISVAGAELAAPVPPPTTTTTQATTTTAAPSTTIDPATLGEPSFVAHYVAGTIELSGTLPSEELIADIETAAAAAYGRGNVINSLEVGAVADADYLPSLSRVFAVAAGLDPWNLELSNDNVSFSGMAADADAVTLKRADFNEFAGTAGGFTGAEAAIEVQPASVAASLTDLLAAGANFETGSATLSGDAIARLDAVIEVMLANPSTVVTVAGHTDDQGDPADNQALSEDRAQAVVDYLVAGGVGGDRLTAIGFGEDDPIASNDTAEGRATNRRIEFVVNEGE